MRTLLRTCKLKTVLTRRVRKIPKTVGGPNKVCPQNPEQTFGKQLERKNSKKEKYNNICKWLRAKTVVLKTMKLFNYSSADIVAFRSHVRRNIQTD